jgi:hypothetical protein
MKVAEHLPQGTISVSELPSMGIRIRSIDDCVPNYERKEESTKTNSILNDKLGKKVSPSNKHNSYKAK